MEPMKGFKKSSVSMFSNPRSSEFQAMAVMIRTLGFKLSRYTAVLPNLPF